MGRAVYESFPNARRTFDQADESLGYALSDICFNGPVDQLNDTRIAQPALLTTSVAILEAIAEAAHQDGTAQGQPETARQIADGSEPRGVAALPEYLRPAFVAGHSLGEFTALVAAGVLKFSDALRLVAERGRLAATNGARGAMSAVIGMSVEQVEKVIGEIVPEGGAVVANDNGPTQVTIAGDSESIVKVNEALSKSGARRVVPLAVSAPFHFPPMGRIGGDLGAFMAGLKFSEPVVPVVANVTGEPHDSAETIPGTLIRHLTQRVQWLNSVRFMAERGASTFVEIGAGQVVSGLVKRIVDVELLSISDPQSIAAAMVALRKRMVS